MAVFFACGCAKIKCVEFLYGNVSDSMHTHHTLTLSPTHPTHTHSLTLAGICLAASSSETQFNWLRALQGAGLTVLPAANEVDDLVKNASSIFDFEAKDIDGQLVSLERYR